MSYIGGGEVVFDRMLHWPHRRFASTCISTVRWLGKGSSHLTVAVVGCWALFGPWSSEGGAQAYHFHTAAAELVMMVVVMVGLSIKSTGSGGPTERSTRHF